MRRYADPLVCPGCSTRLSFAASACPGCALRLDGPLASELLRTLRTADDLLDRLRAESAPLPVPATTYAPLVVPPDRDPRGMAALSVLKFVIGLCWV